MSLKYSDVEVSPLVKNGYKVIKEFTFKGITIPKGYKTNGANIPRILWSVFPPNKSDYLPAVIIHDYLCENSITKEEYLHADNMLRDAMRALQIDEKIVMAFYYAVRLYHKSICFLMPKMGIRCEGAKAYE